ncbi:cytochrome P450 [Streptomyces sp. NPDC049906]|uniref:cytochrome P450 family protein n=1 Tax=Streptomyces sp. NPDC049906 TaxID=3155656 RepID=UPI00343936F5
MSSSVTPTPHDLAPPGTDPDQQPEALYQRLHAEGPVHRVRMLDLGDVWLVVGRAEARAALADPLLRNDLRHSAGWSDDGSYGPGRNMLQTDPPEHTRLRARVTRHFTQARVTALRPRIRQITAELVDALPRSGTADLVDAFAVPLPITVICELLGVPEQDRPTMRAWSRDLITPESDEIGRASSAAMAGYFGELLARKRRLPEDDLLSLLAAPDDEDPLSPEELIGMCFLLVVAGHETTMNLISGALYTLLCQPPLLASVRADPSLLGGVVEETLRFHSPARAAAFRYAAGDTRIGDTAVARGEAVVISLGGAGQDPRGCPHPERFALGRERPNHLGFGHGVHHCPGAPLARTEGVIALTELLARRPELRLAVPPDAVHWRTSVLLRGLDELPVRFG